MLDWNDLHWYSDWNGYEVGYPDIEVVGLYALKMNPKILFYVDTENQKIINAFIEGDNDEL